MFYYQPTNVRITLSNATNHTTAYQRTSYAMAIQIVKMDRMKKTAVSN